LSKVSKNLLRLPGTVQGKQDTGAVQGKQELYKAIMQDLSKVSKNFLKLPGAV
jgi:hypothetical protein